MLSNFIKKLLFTRQLFINNGSIEVMNRKQILLPSQLILLMQNNPSMYEEIKSIALNDFHEISDSFGLKRHEIIKNVEDIFETYGLGKLEISYIHEKEKSAGLYLHNSSLAHAHRSKNPETDQPVCFLTSAVLAGIFSFLLEDDMDCREEKCFAKGDECCWFAVKKKGGNKNG